MKKIFCYILLLIGLGVINSCKWDNPYDENNNIGLSLKSIPDTISNDTTYTIQWEVINTKYKMPKPAKNFCPFDVEIILYRDNFHFLDTIATSWSSDWDSNSKSFTWHVNVLKPYYLYRIQIKSKENINIQAFSNEFIIK